MKRALVLVLLLGCTEVGDDPFGEEVIDARPDAAPTDAAPADADTGDTP